jgi:phosphoglycolate phosphatase-like HAD superfamily hydrolase
MKLLLFDVDATLILTGGAGLRALNRTFQKLFSLESAMSGVAPHGKTDPSIVREIFHKRFNSDHGLGEAEMSRILETYVKFLHEEVEITDKYEVLPGINDILEEMSARQDVVLGLATGNIETGARIKLRRGDLNRFFAFGGYGSDSESRVALVRKAAERATLRYGLPVPNRDVLVIGDTPRDIEAGREAGFRTVGVATGQYSPDQLRDSGADFAIVNFREGRDYFLRSTFME